MEFTDSRYKFVRELGTGGMGVVYLALDQQLKRQVAIKCVKHDLLDKQSANQLIREAATLAQVNHPNVVQIYDIITDKNSNIAIILEYVPGRPLNRLLSNPRISRLQNLRWLNTIIMGLNAIHDQDIIHKDLKAENVLIDQDDLAKISDFGIAITGDVHETVNLQQRTVVGSISTMSPEQIRGEKLTYKSDYFSLGVLTFRMLYGTHPFTQGQTTAAVLNDILHSPPIIPAGLGEKADNKLQHQLLSLLEKEPALRVEDLTEFQAAINEQLVEHPEGDEQSQTIDLQNLIAIKSIQKPRSVWSNFKVPALVAVIFSLGLVLSQSDSASHKPTPQYIVVEEPSISADSTFLTDSPLLAHSIRVALEQQVISASDIHLLPNRTNMVGENSRLKAKQNIPSLKFLATDLHCTNQICNILFTLMHSDGQKILGQTQQQLPLRAVYRPTETELPAVAKLFPNNPSLGQWQPPANSKAYDEYIRLYSLVYYEGQSNHAVLSDIHTLLTHAPELTQTYRLYLDTALDLFKMSGNTRYLDELHDILLGARGYISEELEYYKLMFELHLAKADWRLANDVAAQLQNLGIDPFRMQEIRARLQFTQGDYAGAITNYVAAAHIVPLPKILNNLALSYYYAGQNEKALATLEQILLREPKSFFANELTASIHLAEGNTSDATRYYTTIITQGRGDAQTFGNLGLAYLLEGNFNMANANFIQANQLEPNNPDFLLNLADSFSLLGELETAQQTYAKLISIILHSELQTWEHYNILAQAYAQLGMTKESIEALLSGIRLAPDNSNLSYSGALVYALAGEFTSAEIYAEKAKNAGFGMHWFKLPWFSSTCILPEVSNPSSRCTN